MKHRLFQYFGGVRGGSFILILAFLLLPYVVDVAYYGDLTPTHSAQENIKKSDDDGSYAQDSYLCADDQAHSGEAGLTLHDPVVQYYALEKTIFPPQYLYLASLASRPPPAR